jgi:outer membrane receptor protein involved in Fe transport
LSISHVQSTIHGNQTIPLANLAQSYLGYSLPDETQTQSTTINLHGNIDLGQDREISGQVYYRSINRQILNSNVGEWLGSPDASNQAGCADAGACPASNLLARVQQNTSGLSAQYAARDLMFSMPHRYVVGMNAETGNSQFQNDGQNGWVDGRTVVGIGPWLNQAQISSNVSRYGVYSTDTFKVSEQDAITVSARYDLAKISLNGASCIQTDGLCVAGTGFTDVSGEHSYSKFNPSVGLAHHFENQLTGFANLAQGFRTPSAIELACADPNAPCNGLPNAFSSDPNLKAVVSHTFELGFRQKPNANFSWSAAVFRTQLQDDIIFNQTNATQGYFSNAAKTLRQGVELQIESVQGRLDYGASLNAVDARFGSSFGLANPANSSCVQNGNSCSGVYAQPGDRIPGVSRWLGKFNLGYQFSPQFHLAAALFAQSSQYARGDENNQDLNGALPGFVVARMDAVYRIDEKTEAGFGINNLFNTRYSSFANLGFNNIGSGQATQFRSVAAPRAAYVNLQARF